MTQATLPLNLQPVLSRGFAADVAPAATLPLGALDVGPFFELGWDHAHHGLAPAAVVAARHDALRHGWQAGRAVFGRRTLAASPAVRQWLGLRLAAAEEGRSFEAVQLTPHHLQQIDNKACPVTRETLTPGEAVIVRVRDDAGYAAGNLAALSRRASAAKAALGWTDATERVRMLDAAGGRSTPGFSPQTPVHRLSAAAHGSASASQGAAGEIDGLDTAAWARLAVLMSFVTPLPHEQAATLPLLVLPPNRLRVLNAVQGLQALVTLQMAEPGRAARLRGVADLLPGDALRHDFNLVLGALAPRVLEAGRLEGLALRQALEDAWRNTLLNRRWQRFALQLTAGTCEAILRRAVALLEPAPRAARQPRRPRVRTVFHAAPAATEGWALETRGWQAEAARREPAAATTVV